MRTTLCALSTTVPQLLTCVRRQAAVLSDHRGTHGDAVYGSPRGGVGHSSSCGSMRSRHGTSLTARTARTTDTAFRPADKPALQCVSTMATQPLEDVARAGQPSPALWFQLYVLSDRDFVKGMVMSASQLAVAVTLQQVWSLSLLCCRGSQGWLPGHRGHCGCSTSRPQRS